MFSLDNEEGMVAERPVSALSTLTGRTRELGSRLGLRSLLKIALVLGLGGSLGAAGYMLSNLDSRDVIGVLDVSDTTSPRLSFDMPSRDGQPHSTADLPASMLTPPGQSSATAGGENGAAPSGLDMFKSEVARGNPKATEIGAYAPRGGASGAAGAGPAGTVAAPPAPVVVPAQPTLHTGELTPTYASLPPRPPLVDPLSPVPVDAMIKASPNGPLPIIGKDGRQAWQVYARPYDGPTNQARFAVIVTGLGLEKEATEAAISKLPPEVTLAFSPYAAALDRWVRRARDAGHEVLLMLPTEPANYPARDPGPWGLLTSNAPEENLTRLEKVLSRAPGYVGVITQDGGPFMRSVQLTAVLLSLKERGLMYVGAGARGETLPAFISVTAEADQEPFRDAIDARLAQIANSARETGKAVAIISARPVALDRVVAWIEQSTLQDLVLAPVSALAAPPIQAPGEKK